MMDLRGLICVAQGLYSEGSIRFCTRSIRVAWNLLPLHKSCEVFYRASTKVYDGNLGKTRKIRGLST